MQQVSEISSRNERILFELFCNTNELHQLRDSLSILDIDEIEKAVKKLGFILKEYHRKPSQVYHLTV